MSIIEEYDSLQEETTADLLAMQVGDFYEFFKADAETVSRTLGLQLSERSSHGENHSMAGVPKNDIDMYVERLVDSHNYTVAVAEQFQTDSGSYQRRISHVVTPGTLVESTNARPRYLATVLIDSTDSVGIGICSPTTGQILVTSTDVSEIVDTLSIYTPDEIIIQPVSKYATDIQQIQQDITDTTEAYITSTSAIADIDTLQQSAEDQFGSHIADSIQFSESDSDLCLASAGYIISYLQETNSKLTDSITQLTPIGTRKYMDIDARTRNSLELIQPMNSTAGRSLLDVLDHTVTTTGKQQLQTYIQRPLTDIDMITTRQESIHAIQESAISREQIIDCLQQTPNIQHILSKVSFGSASPKQLYSLVDGLETVQQICDIIQTDPVLSDTNLEVVMSDLQLDVAESVTTTISNSLSSDPSSEVEIGTIARGYDDELDTIIQEYAEIDSWFSSLEADLKEEYGLSHCTVDRNQTDGYYIQVGKSGAEDVPDTFDKIKSLKNSVRFKTQGIRDREAKYMRLEEERLEMERTVYKSLLSEVEEYASVFQDIGSFIAELDALQSLAIHSVQNNWTQPIMKKQDTASQLSITDGSHPVVEQTVEYTPNSVQLDRSNSFGIVTGPNMSGKSTYLRQVALIVLLSHIGSDVPAEDATIPITDAIFTRIGARDEISMGRSTFMVEMSELANILHSASDKSLVLLDEIGRGTATADGMALARATVSYLTDNSAGPSPFCLFATHYHSLTEMSDTISTVFNKHFEIDPQTNTFNRNVQSGPTDKSYGINIAEMAGVPPEVTSDAEDNLSSY